MSVECDCGQIRGKPSGVVGFEGGLGCSATTRMRDDSTRNPPRLFSYTVSVTQFHTQNSCTIQGLTSTPTPRSTHLSQPPNPPHTHQSPRTHITHPRHPPHTPITPLTLTRPASHHTHVLAGVTADYERMENASVTPSWYLRLRSSRISVRVDRGSLLQ